MGNQLVPDEELSESFQQQYSLQEHPYLLHKSTGEPFTLHKISTNSPEDTSYILENIRRYKQSQCGSISRLKEHYHSKKRSYCSDQENIYLLFHDHARSSIKDQYLMRRYLEHRFSPEEIEIIMEAMLCGLRQYHTNFHRSHQQFGLQNVCVQPQSHRVYVRDPWLSPTAVSGSFTNVLLSYPSPEKLTTLYQDKDSIYDQYYSDLWTVGMYGLQLYHMNFMDEIYNTKKKQIDRQKLFRFLEGSQVEPRLNKGLRILLQSQPFRRKDIFTEWNINHESHKILTRLEKEVENRTGTSAGYGTEQIFLDPYGDKAYLNVASFSNNNQELYGSRANRNNPVQSIGLRAIPVNTSQFNTSLYSTRHYPSANVQGGSQFSNTPNNPYFQSRNTQFVDPNTHLLPNKSASNLSGSPPAWQRRHQSPLNKQSENRYQSNSFIPNGGYPPRYNFNTQSLQRDPKNERVQERPKLLAIQRPDQKYRNQSGNQRVLMNQVQNDRNNTSGFNRVSPPVFKKTSAVYSQQRQNEPLVQSFDYSGINTNKIKVSSVNNSFQRGPNLNHSSYNRVNQSSQQSSSLQKSQNITQQNMIAPIFQPARPRSISNQSTITNPLHISNTNFSSNQNYDWRAKNRQNVILNLARIQTRNDSLELQENIYKDINTLKANSISTLHKDSINSAITALSSFNKTAGTKNSENMIIVAERKQQFQNYNRPEIKVLDNNPNLNQKKVNSNIQTSIHGENAETFSNTLKSKTQEQRLPTKGTNWHPFFSSYASQNNKSPIQEWKTSEQQPIKKEQSPPKPINQQNQTKQQNQNEEQADEAIFTEIKSYAESLFGFKPQQKSEDPVRPEPNDQNSRIQNPSQETTPNRPPEKNKYNSTIVEVNQETPQQSESSNQGDVQYVIEQYETGSRYEGQKVNGMRNGRGKFFYQDGGHYQGQWKKNKMHGWGKLYYEGGRLAYEGHWSHDEFHGYGKVYNDNPIPLETPFDYTNFDMLDDFWNYYEGTLVSDTKEGRGRIKLTNGQIFEGDFHADRIQGFGKYYTTQGNFIEGIWRESKLIKVINTS